MTYRLMTEGDIPRVIPFYMECYNAQGDTWTEETVYKRVHQVLTREDALCLIAEEDGGAVAFAMGSFEQFYDLAAYDLVEIVVAPKWQGKGVGTALMAELERRVKDAGGAMIMLDAVNDEMHEHFYGKLQYHTCTNLVLKSKFL